MVLSRSHVVGIFLFDGVELLDYAGPAEVFSVAQPENEENREHTFFTVITIAEKSNFIKPSSGSPVKPDYTLKNHPAIDILILPGGMGSRNADRRKRLIPWLLQQNKKTKIISSVCTGAFFLADAGLLDKKTATTHWRGKQWLKEYHPKITVVNKRYVDEGHIVTSAGISAGIDMAFHIVERLYGEKVASWTAHLMEYNWKR